MDNDVDSQLAQIARVGVDKEVLLSADREAVHMETAFYLLREATALTALCGSMTTDPEACWSVGEAVVGGSVVRLFRLLRALIEQSNERRAEIAWVIARMAVETVVNIRYLVKHYSPDLISSYVNQSLQHEVRLKNVIEANIQARGGEVLPIERRMLRSIERDFTRSGVSPEDMPRIKIKNWGGRSVFERAKDIGLGEAYLSLFGAPSRNVHGNWHDLLQHNLSYVEGCGFQPRTEDRAVRPHLLHAVGILSVEALLDYLSRFDAQGTASIRRRLDELLARLEAANSVHEEWLSNRGET